MRTLACTPVLSRRNAWRLRSPRRCTSTRESMSERRASVRLCRRVETPRRGSRIRRGLCRRSEEHTSELQSPYDIVCRLLLEKKKHVDMSGNGTYHSMYT